MKSFKALLILIIFPIFVFSQTPDSENASLKGRWAYGSNNVVKIDGTDLYMGSGGVLTIGKVNKDGNITKYGKIQFNHKINDIESDGNTVFVALGLGGVKIVDVSNSSEPVVVDSVKFTYPGSGEELYYSRLNISDGYLFLIAPTWSFMTDYSDLHNIYVLNNFTGADGAEIKYLVKKDEFIYQLQGGTSVGLVVYQRFGDGSISISSVHTYNQESPSATENPIDIKLANDLIYILDSYYGMFIMSVGTDGTTYVHSNISGDAKKILVQENYAFILDPFNKIKVVNIIDSYTASIVKEVALPEPADILTDFEISEDSIIVIASLKKGFYSYDFTDPMTPTQEDFMKGWSPTNDIAIAGDLIYVAADYQGLKILQNTEVNGQIIPTEIGAYPASTGSYFDKVLVYNSYAYVRTPNGIKSINISDPTSPTEGGFYTLSYVNNIVAKDGYLYSADDNGLTVLDISDPTNISLAGTFAMPEYPTDLKIQGNNVFLAGGTRGLRVLNVSDPTNITEIGTYDDDNEYYEYIQIQENYAYIIDGDFGLKIFNISTPTNPTLAGTYSLYDNDSWASNGGLTVSGSYVYVAIARDMKSDIIKEINISNPAAAVEKGYFTMGEFVSSMASDDLYFYVSDYDDGIYILQNDNIDALPQCHVRGNQYGIWDCDTIFVIGNCVVPEGQTLTIESGTKVFFRNNYTIDVNGAINAIGSESDTIKFIAENTDLGWGGITLYDSDGEGVPASQFDYCLFSYGNANGINSYEQRGGAISIVNASNISIKNTVFYHNEADLMGGALYIENGLPEIFNCQFYNNYALTGVGGAIAIIDASPELKQLTLITNGARDGGAIAIQNGSPIISNSLFENNAASGLGQAMHLFGASPNLINVTLAANGSGTSRVIYGMSNSNPVIINSILWNGADQNEISLEEGTPTVTYSDIRNASNETWFGAGCIDTDPLFTMDPGYQLSSTEYGYSENSPAIDAGHPESVDVSLSALMGKGTTRADMGTYGGGETTIHVGTNNLPITPDFTVYPNPTQNTTTLEISGENIGEYQYSIYNLVGQMIEMKEVAGLKRLNIDFSTYKTGIYFIKVEIEDKVYMRQIIKK